MDEAKVKNQMDQVVQLFLDDIGTIRTGRASPGLIEAIEVSVYGGTKMKLMELGTTFVEGARSLVFAPWDKSIAGEIKNGILKSGAGYSPIVDNDKIRINLPLLTSEERENYVKLLGKKLEAARVMIREARSEERRLIQDQLKEKGISEDDYHLFEEKLQKITDEYIEKIEQVSVKKEAEIRGE